MNPFEIDSIAHDMVVARDKRALAERPGKANPAFSLEQGYAVCAVLDKGLRSNGYQPVGRKIGFTNPATWQEFGLETPIWAYVYDRTVRFCESSEELVSVRLGNLVQPRIETELVLQVNDRILEAATEPARLVEALEWIAIGFEIVQCHYHGWEFTAAEAVADFCLHSELIVGAKLSMTQELQGALTRQLETFQVALECNGTLQARGSGDKVLGSPLQALAFLIRVLATQAEAHPLQAGEVITTGTMTPILPIQAGETWSTRITGLDLAGISVETTE